MKKIHIATGLILIAVILTCLVFIVEHPHGNLKGPLDALWWLIVTISTVGYGDIVPQTTLGKVIGMFVIITGTILFTFVTGSVASHLVDLKLREREGRGKITFNNHIIIIGNSPKTEEILTGLTNLWHDSSPPSVVLVNTASPEQLELLKNKFPNLNMEFFRGDSSSEAILKQAGAHKADKAIILLDQDSAIEESEKRNLHTVLALRAISEGIEIYVETTSEENKKHLLRAGANEVILHGEFVEYLAAGLLSCSGMGLLLRNLMDTASPKLKIISIEGKFRKKPYREFLTHLRQNNLLPIAIVYSEENIPLDQLLTQDEAIDEIIKSALSELPIDDTKEQTYHVRINPSDDYIINEKDKFAIVVTS
ncbi:ion transporter [Thermosulfidibacter takaii ABI70S6]|uniref:Ion transporter n=1 Tax=Thermosulfidibacter takaii (strain DSM 17441 / JCM 13301 / NBRC 103674 / ABI70S6) TaxID=1298851 RepID=A0A0S3QUJ9_THET7|nr:potassium channel family protein [Thermosulfidibacter takaii]BAT72004.1 ion transporter [Thermosulfidibacter takaii ABI70S6]